MNILEEARNELFSELENLTEEVFNQKPSEEKWSIKQILEHLYLYEVAATKAIREEIQHGDNRLVKEQPIHLTTNRKNKFIAPAFSQPSDTFLTIDDVKKKMIASRKQLLELIATTDEETLLKKSLPHPGFKMLSLKQYIEFLGWHERRHLLQMKEVKDLLGV